jgi:DNA phosphorothioation-associated putative methyltransferase
MHGAAARIQRHKTAMRRSDLSRPMRLALHDGVISSTSTVFDYGCGQGGDLRRLAARGIACSGWDPTFRPEAERTPAEVVNLGYVVNVIESREEREAALTGAWSLAQRALIVSARMRSESDEAWRPWGDGFITGRDTFQKFYEQQELRDWIDQTLGVSSIPAAPGVFYVFRDSRDAQTYLASRFRRRSILPMAARVGERFETFRGLLQPMMDFFGERGRLPEVEEIERAGEIQSEFGSIKRAFAVVLQATDSQQWAQISESRSQDLLVYLALQKFGGRPSFGDLPEVMQLDIRGLFSNYRRACELADELLFSAGDPEQISRACAESVVGKITYEALYLHVDALPYTTPLVRVYEGCARAYVGSVEDANILKLHRKKPQVSYLSYPDFDSDPHPALRESLKVRFRGLQIEYRDYRDTANPFILHRKETFLPKNHESRAKYEKLTRQEEKHGLFENANRIGTRDGWRHELRARGLTLRGHRVVRVTKAVEQ